MKKLFALLCVIALLGALCIPTMAAPARVPVVAEVPSDWTTVYLYVWGGSESMTWPGVPMTEIDGWYVAYMNDDNANIIINNGSNAQTQDLTVDPGLPVCVMAGNIDKVTVGPDLPLEVPAEDKMPKPATDKIYALVPESWTTANLYAWTADASGNNGGWPGVPMTKGDNGLWVGELNPGFANIIINDGGAQTVDLPYSGGDAWVMLTAEAGSTGKFEAGVYYEDPGAPYKYHEGGTVTPPAAPFENAYVAGTMNGWTNPDEAYKMTKNSDGTFTLTFSVPAGANALKVTDGTWDRSFGGSGADGNYEFNATAAGDITVTFDGSSVVTVTGDIIEPITPPVDGGTWYVAGTMNNWTNPDEAYKMIDLGDGIFGISFNVAAGDHSLKVTNGTWDICYGDPNSGDPDGNYLFNASDEGNVNILFDSNSTTVSHNFDAPILPPETEPTTGTEPTTNGTEPITTTGGEQPIDLTLGVGFLVGGLIVSILILIAGAVVVFLILKKK